MFVEQLATTIRSRALKARHNLKYQISEITEAQRFADKYGWTMTADVLDSVLDDLNIAMDKLDMHIRQELDIYEDRK